MSENRGYTEQDIMDELRKCEYYAKINKDNATGKNFAMRVDAIKLLLAQVRKEQVNE